MVTVVYQIFVDRFARAVTTDTVEPPRGTERFGGDLDGIAAHLDHVVELGADALYLTPIFCAPSNHKYDTVDFDRVDPDFGGDAAWDRLVAAARARGLGLILDGVFNHVSEHHPWVTAAGHRFRGSSWRGYGNLRELAVTHPEVDEALFGADGVVARWTRRGATGWRLDCANDLGPDACRRAAHAARRAGAVDGIVGEVMAYPTGWAEEGGLDGVMNYWLRSAALALASGRAPAAQVQAALDRLVAEMPPVGLARSWSILATHDTPRLATVLSDDGAGATVDDATVAARVRLAFALQLAYPGKPLVYYGEEIGMRGGPDPANRAPMCWDRAAWDTARLAFVRRCAQLRRALPALGLDGRYVALPQPGTDFVCFARVTERPSETLIFVANAAGAPRAARLFLALPHLYDALPLVDELDPTAPPLRVEAGTVDLALPPHGAVLLGVRDDHPSGYRFFKGV
jgi:glycosidase